MHLLSNSRVWTMVDGACVVSNVILMLHTAEKSCSGRIQKSKSIRRSKNILVNKMYLSTAFTSV